MERRVRIRDETEMRTCVPTVAGRFRVVRRGLPAEAGGAGTVPANEAGKFIVLSRGWFCSSHLEIMVDFYSIILDFLFIC